MWIAVRLLLFLCFVGMCQPGSAQESDGEQGALTGWPQWRGPMSSGVSARDKVPLEWDRNSPNLKWKIDIPGNGISQPIATQDKIFVTTSYQVSMKRSLAANITAMSLVLVPWLLILQRRSMVSNDSTGNQPESAPSNWVERVDRMITIFTSVVSIILVILVAIGPDAVNVALEPLRLLGVSLMRILGREDAHLSFLHWSEVNRDTIWVISGGISLLAVIAASGFFNMKSNIRVLTSLAVALSVYVIANNVPSTPAQRHTLGMQETVFVSFPAIVVATWQLTAYLFSHVKKLSTKSSNSNRDAMSGLSMLSMAGLLFFPANYLHTTDSLYRVVICFDSQHGDKLWESPVFDAPGERKYTFNSHATPTPCTDGKYLVASFGSGLGCLDLQGNLLWSKVDLAWIGDSVHGAASSPVIAGNKVILFKGREKEAKRPSTITAYDLQTGQVRWEVKPETANDSYSTPLLIQRGGISQLITFNMDAIIGYDVETGDSLWKHEVRMRGETIIPSMVASGDYLFFGGGTGGGGCIGALRLTGEGKDTSAELLWKKRGRVPDISSPVVYDGKLFAISSLGIMTCYDSMNGKVHWKKRLRAGTGDYLSSLVACEGRVYVCNTSGITSVVAAEDRFQLLAKNDLEEPIYASPAIVDNGMLLRTEASLFRIEAGN